MSFPEINYMCERCGQADNDTLVCTGVFAWNHYEQKWDCCETTAEMQWWCGVCNDFVTVKKIELEIEEDEESSA